MAPRRGGGGGGGGSGSSSVSCPNPWGDYGRYSTIRDAAIAYFASYCLFFVLTLGIMITLCCVRKRRLSALKLIGPIFDLSLLCSLMYAFPRFPNYTRATLLIIETVHTRSS
jgi:hypothetical protein